MGPRHRRVAWTEGALRELNEAAEYIALDSPGNAASLVTRLLDTADSLDCPV